jgi:hypothetical protein
MEFDLNDRFLVSYGKEIVNIIPLDEEENPNKYFNYIIDKKSLSFAIDLQFVSQSKSEFRCEIACKAKDRKFVRFWIITEKESSIDKERSISYLQDDITSMKVQFSKDFSSIICMTCKEKYSFTREGEGWCQRVITSLKERHIEYIHAEDDHFFLLCSRHYDR